MRCPDCQKFVSLDNVDPDVSDLSIELQNSMLLITASVRCVRACAECGGELKEITHDFSEEVDPMELPQIKESKELQENLKDIEFDIEPDSCEIEESGGGRYAKNIIACVLAYRIKAKYQDHAFSYDGSMTEEAAASSYEEL